MSDIVRRQLHMLLASFFKNGYSHWWELGNGHCQEFDFHRLSDQDSDLIPAALQCKLKNAMGYGTFEYYIWILYVSPSFFEICQFCPKSVGIDKFWQK